MRKTRLRLHEKSSTLDVTKVLVDTATAKRSCKYECLLSDTQLPQMLSMIESNRFHYKSTIMKEYRYELKTIQSAEEYLNFFDEEFIHSSCSSEDPKIFNFYLSLRQRFLNIYNDSDNSFSKDVVVAGH